MPLKVTPEKQAQIDALRKAMESRGLLDSMVAGYRAKNPNSGLQDVLPIVKDLGPIKRTREQGGQLVGLALDLENDARQQGMTHPSLINTAVYETLKLPFGADAEYRTTMPYRRAAKR